MNLTVGSLFSGIGGIELGFERAGFKTAWQVERDPYCRKILARHFPQTERFDDVRSVGCSELAPVDVVVGGFPCQDISVAGDMAGIDAPRSGLWREFHRIVRVLRPRYALIENVAALVGLGLERVLCDLAGVGYDAEWQIVSAAAIGASHWRNRIWILAYPGREGVHERGRDSDALSEVPELRRASRHELSREQSVSDEVLVQLRGLRAGSHPHWNVEPGVARVANGVSNRMDRIRGCGNSVVPQIPEMYARAIAQRLQALRAVEQ